MGRHVEEQLHLWDESCTDESWYYVEALINALAADEADCAWRPRPPTLDEQVVHVCRHGRGQWMRKSPQEQLHLHTLPQWGIAEDAFQPGEWRALDDDGAPCEWPPAAAGEVRHG